MRKLILKSIKFSDFCIVINYFNLSKFLVEEKIFQTFCWCYDMSVAMETKLSKLESLIARFKSSVYPPTFQEFISH